VQTAGPAVTLTGATGDSPTFTAPPAPGVLSFELTVTDDEGLTATDTVDVALNQRPTADAGSDRTVQEGSAVSLDGTDSADPDSGDLEHSWVQTGGPAVTLSGASTATATFTAPDGPATLGFELTVTDELGRDHTDTVTITVNDTPVADAGEDRTVDDGAAVTLEGSDSADSEDDTLDFGWVQTGGPAVTLDGASTDSPTFTTAAGSATLTFELTVSDSDGGSDTDTVVVTVEGSAPSVELATTAGDPVGGSFPLTITFSEPVTGFTVDDLETTNATLTGFSGTGTSYAVTVAPTADGTVSVEVPAAVATDGAGTGNLVSNTVTRTHDATRPSVDLTAPPGPVNGPFEVTLTFSEPVTGLALSELEVTNGTATGLAGSGTTYTVTVSPTADGTVTVGLPAAAADDAAGNASTVSNTLTRTADLGDPTVVLSAPAGPHNGAFTVTATFSEPVTGLTRDDVLVTNGAATSLDGSGATYSFVVTPAADGTVTVALPGGSASDAAGNANPAATPLTRTYDATAPTMTVTRTAGQADPVRAGQVVFTARASEPVSDLTPGHIALLGTAGADATSVRRVDATTFELTVTGMRTDGTVQVRTAGGAVRDAAGNPAAERSSDAVTWSATALPRVIPVFDQSCVGNGGVLALRLDPDDGSELTVTSSNAALLPSSRIELTGTAGLLELAVRPRGGESGTARVTVTATNAAGSHRLVVRVVVGTSGPDRIAGSRLTDVVLGRGGSDSLRGGKGTDLLCGGGGDDRLRGGDGNDSLYGHSGDDVMKGGRNRNRFVGGPGRDTIRPGRAGSRAAAG
jgi:hypothetical protein